MSRFHSKLHQKSHHTNPTVDYPDSASDPIASHDSPFKGDFVIDGSVYADTLSLSDSISSLEVDTLIVNNPIASLNVNNITGNGAGLTNVNAITLNGSFTSGDFEQINNKNQIGGYLGIDGNGSSSISNNLNVANNISTTTLNFVSVSNYLTQNNLSSTVAPLITSDNEFGYELPDEVLPSDITGLSSINSVDMGDYLVSDDIGVTVQAYDVTILTDSDLSSTVAPLIDSVNSFGKELPKEFLPNEAMTTNYVGFFDYNASNSLSSVALTQNTWVKIENDITGPYTLTSYGPDSLTGVWDEITHNFDWSELDMGDMVDIRVDIDVTLTDNNSHVEVDLVLAEGSVSEYRLSFCPSSIFKSSGTYKITSYNGIYIGNVDTLNNGGFFEIRTDDSAATMKVNGFYCKITRRTLG